MAGHTEYVRISWLDEIQSQLETGQSLTVRWPGEKFDAKATSEWITPDASLGFTPEPINGNGSKRVERWTLQVDCVARSGESPDDTQVYRIDEIVDLVVEEFRWKTLDVVNWDSGDPKPSVGTLQFLQPSVDTVELLERGGTADHKVVTLPAQFSDISI